MRLLVEVRQHRAAAGDLCLWATTALTDGFDTPALRELAGLDLAPVSVFEAEPLLVRALGELGFGAMLNDVALLREYERELAAAILSGTTPVHQALELMHSRVVAPLEHAWEVFPWCLLWEGNDPYDIGTSPEARDIELRAIQYAREVVATAGATPLALHWLDKRWPKP